MSAVEITLSEGQEFYVFNGVDVSGLPKRVEGGWEVDSDGDPYVVLDDDDEKFGLRILKAGDKAWKCSICSEIWESEHMAERCFPRYCKCEGPIEYQSLTRSGRVDKL